MPRNQKEGKPCCWAMRHRPVRQHERNLEANWGHDGGSTVQGHNSTLFAELWVAVKTAGLLVLVVVAAAHVQAGPCMGRSVNLGRSVRAVYLAQGEWAL